MGVTFVGSNSRIGIGTDNPTSNLHITSGISPTLRLEQNATSGFTPQTWDVAGDDAHFFVRDVTNSANQPFKIAPNAPTNTVVLSANGNVGLGIQAPNAALEVAGDVMASGSFISNGTTLSVPDFVFSPDYQLLPIAELASFVADHRHLPDVPSGREIHANGLDVTKMQIVLLEKVEELTLYTIQQQQTIDQLRSEMAEMSAVLEAFPN